MPQYVLLVYYPEAEDRRRREGGLTQEEMAQEHQRWEAFRKDLQDSEVLVSNAGLQGVDAAATVRVRDGETQISDGPVPKAEDLLAGYWHIEAKDLDAALAYAARIPAATHGSIEVRPLWG